LPRKSSRTSTQASSVPKIAFVRATSAATAIVSFSAATASGWVTQYRNWERPSARDAQTSAAIGSATTTLRYVVMKPSERAVAALSLRSAFRRV
jgi:hypothetical protein